MRLFTWFTPFVESHFMIHRFLTNGFYCKISRENGLPKGWLEGMPNLPMDIALALTFVSDDLHGSSFLLKVILLFIVFLPIVLMARSLRRMVGQKVGQICQWRLFTLFKLF